VRGSLIRRKSPGTLDFGLATKIVSKRKPGGGEKSGIALTTSLRHHDACMRTTLTLDPDVAAKAREGAARLHKPFKEVINAALRVGLDEILAPPTAKPYRTKPRPMGLRRGFNYDNISELIASAEGEDHS
jgi:hypothetical protein